MSDSEIPQHDPEGNGASGPSVAGPGSGLPHDGQSADQPASKPHAPQGPSGAGRPGAGKGKFAPFRLDLANPRVVWAAVALLCVVAGAVAALLGARAVANSDATSARQVFPKTSAEVASRMKSAIQHEEDLIVGTSTYFAGNPKASAAEFNAWVKWAQLLHRFPELESLGFVIPPPAPEPSASLSRASTRATAFSKSLGGAALSKTLEGAGTAAGAISARLAATANPARAAAPTHCFTSVELARGAAWRSRGLDYCTTVPGLGSSRDSGLSVYGPFERSHALSIETPVYRGSVPPPTIAGRRESFVGWLHEVLLPTVLMRQALAGHPEYAMRLRYKAGRSSVTFTSGTAQPGAQSVASNLHDHWTLTSLGPPPASASVLSDGNALTILIGGLVLSVLLGLLVFLLGARRRAAPAPARAAAQAHEDLYDALTGLPNRALMLDRAERMLARATRQSGLLVGALFIDIDWFKDVNEKLGMDAGNQLLTIVAERLEGVVRAHDTVGRMGGDEFVVLVESAARGVRLDSLARRVIEALHRPVELNGFGPSFSLTASIGVAFGRYETPEDLLHDAQLAMHAAAAAGRDRYTLFNANMRSVIEGRGVLEEELNAALQAKQFFLLYQPIYDLATRQVVGLEAQIRWMHPAQGIVAPADFIPLAEETGLIVPIGRWVLEEACARVAAWNVAGNRVAISVPVSANQLNRDGFVTDVRRALQQSGIEPSLLTLEIPETAIMRQLDESINHLHEIKQLGVLIAIDDFEGAGHTDLRRMPVDFLRVDWTALAAWDDEDYRSWLLEAILIVGRDLSVTVIAKGVETQEQVATLQAMGCTLAQGYFIGKPTPVDAVESLFDAGLPSSPAASG